MTVCHTSPLVFSGLILLVCGQVDLLGKKIEEMTRAQSTQPLPRVANTAVLVDPVSPSTQVAAVSDDTTKLTAEVEQFEMQMPTTQYVSMDPAPTEEQERVAIQLEQKGGWLYKKGGMMNAAYQKRYFVLQNGVLAWYSSEQTSETTKLQNGWISCCGLAIETDTGENHKGRACFTAKALSGSTTRRIELACDTASERREWVLALQQLQPVQLPVPKVLFARVLVQVRHHAGAPPRSLVLPRLARTT